MNSGEPYPLFDAAQFGRDLGIEFRSIVGPLITRLGELETKIAILEAREPLRGEKGDAGPVGPIGPDGLPGKDGEVGPRGEVGPPGRDGINGKDADPVEPEAIAAAIAAYLEEHPPPAGRDGRDGIDGKDGTPGREGLIGPAGPQGPDGAPGRDGRDGMSGVPGPVGERGRDGVDGKDGTPGKDGADGLGFEDMTEEITDDGRTIIRRYSRGEVVKEFRHRIYRTKYCGVYRQGEEYDEGDFVTWDGSLWHADTKTTAKPGKGNGWTLATKHGRDGKDGDRGPPGPVGPAGKDGRDLTQMGPDGRKWG